MIRTLHTPFLRERTVAQVSKSVHSSPHSSPARCTHHFSTLNITRDHSLLTLRGYLLVPLALRDHHHDTTISRTRRRYSTIPEQQRNANSKEGPPPIGILPSNKPKVDLRPAPKRVVKEARPSNPVPASQSSATQQSQQSQQSLSDSSSSAHADARQQSTEHLGAFESTKYDFNESVRRGVFSAPPVGASKMAALWHNLKQYFWFYYRGLSLILVTHRRHVAAIRKRIRDARAKGEDASMTRVETRFVRQYKRNILKLSPFVVTLLVLEEAIPFIVLYAPGLLPSTCLLPSQRERIEAKRRSKQRRHMASVKVQLHQVQSIPALSQKGISSLSSDMSKEVAGVLARWTFGPSFLQRHLISRYLGSIAEDDTLLLRENSGSSLQDGELTEALEERGMIWDSPLSRQEKLSLLQWWLKGAQDESSRLQLVLQYAKDAKITS